MTGPFHKKLRLFDTAPLPAPHTIHCPSFTCKMKARAIIIIKSHFFFASHKRRKRTVMKVFPV